MKKKPLTIKTHLRREKTPEITLHKKKYQTLKNQGKPDNQGESFINKKKVFVLKDDNSLNVSKIKNIKSSELNKSMIEPKRDNKKENKTINQNFYKTEYKIKSDTKRIIKQKNKDKKEELGKKNINEKNKDNNNIENNINENNDNNTNKEKDNNANQDNNNKTINKDNKNNKDIIINKKDNSNLKSKTKANKNYRNDPRRKSFDIALDKNKKKLKELDKIEKIDKIDKIDKMENNNKNRHDTKMTDRVFVKTPNQTKHINYKKKDITPLKSGHVEKKGELKNTTNKTKGQIINKTPDARKMGNLKNSINEKAVNKKQKYGNVDIKSIIKQNKDKNKINDKDRDNSKEKTNNNNKDQKLVDIKKDEKVIIKYRNITNKKYNSNYVESLYLTLNKGFFSPNKKLKIIINSKDLYSNFDDKKIIKELIDYYNKIGKENILSNFNKKYDIEKVNEPFKPLERSINALNFLDKNEEKKLLNEIQHPYIIEFFRTVLIFLNEYTNNTDNKNIFEFLFNDILQKYKAKNIKKLMLNKFVDERLIINDEQFNLIQKMLKTKPDLFSPATLLRYNRAVAYFSFFIKDLFSYLNLKTEDGQYYYKIRDNMPQNKYQEKINKLKQLL